MVWKSLVQALPASEPRFGIFVYDDGYCLVRVFLTWYVAKSYDCQHSLITCKRIPEVAPIKHRMRYASIKDTIKRTFGIHYEIGGSEPCDLDYPTLAEKLSRFTFQSKKT